MTAQQKKIVDALNQDRADELAAITQYMGHHYTAQGLESVAVVDMFKSVAIDEMKHAEALGERIAYLGGEPVTKPSAIVTGGDVKKMLKDDLASEHKAIANYKAHIKLCEQSGDVTTRVLLEGILGDEEGHADKFSSALGIR
jgi:bacterioferritin